MMRFVNGQNNKFLHNKEIHIAEQSWEHETRKRRVSCISIQTREPQVETRNKHEKSQNTKQTRKLEKFT